jgi:hypothetical protein
MATFVGISVVLQVAMVVTGHFVEAVINLSALLGMGIPLVVGGVFGASKASDYRNALSGGFTIGIAGAFVGILLAVLMGDQEWLLLTFGPISSAVTGLIGAVTVFFAMGRSRKVAPDVTV